MRRLKQDFSHFSGCLIGGAIGDALGWPVEFHKLPQIHERFGPEGITDFPEETGQVTDDTQMTLFTAEGILRYINAEQAEYPTDLVQELYVAYLRWLVTQGSLVSGSADTSVVRDGWLFSIPDLYHRRAPGMTCLSALASGKCGTINRPLNNSKGCGGVMRVAPCGLYARGVQAYELGCRAAAITHSHPLGYVTAGAFALMIAELIDGAPLEAAIGRGIEQLYRDPMLVSSECAQLLERAVRFAQELPGDLNRLRSLGEGWVAEECLAIAVYAALSFPDNFEKALIFAVNHDGDSDSTGAVTGNLLGAFLGIDAIPEPWVRRVEFKEILAQVAIDLLLAPDDQAGRLERYPVVVSSQ